jgi:hypothetical protein
MQNLLSITLLKKFIPKIPTLSNKLETVSAGDSRFDPIIRAENSSLNFRGLNDNVS